MTPPFDSADPSQWITPYDWVDPTDPLWLRIEAERLARKLTHAQRDVLLALAHFRGPDGSPAPDAMITAAVGCCARTVCRARATAKALGIEL